MKKGQIGKGLSRIAVFAFFLLAALGLTLSAPVKEVRAATKYGAYFREPGGSKTTAMAKLRATVKAGEALTLPKPPGKKGYVCVGWSTKKNPTEAEYKYGAKVILKKNTVFYAVRRKYYFVKFNNNKGTSTSALYTCLRKKVYENRYCLLPEVPETPGYRNLGWTTAKGKTSPLYAPGKKVKITKATTFYAVQEKTDDCTVSFADPAGKMDTSYSALTKTVRKGDRITFPAVANPEGYTFVGWSEKQQDQVVKYLAGESAEIAGDRKFFAVMRANAMEEEIGEDKLATGWQQYYRKIIFVGDSRTNRMANTLHNEFVSSPRLANIMFISREGEGLEWLQNSGIALLKNTLATYYSKMPTAVIFNLGVNDMGNGAAGYVSCLEELAKELAPKNVKMFFMSINPINSVMIERSGKAKRNESTLLAFNEMIRNTLCGSGGSCTYIDAFSYLIQEGYSHDSGMGDRNAQVQTVDDGLHYSGKTYKRIFNYCVESVIRAR